MERPDRAKRSRRRSSVPVESHVGNASPDDTDPTSPIKTRKVSRACDFCKSRKARCSGTQPCSKCVAKGQSCLYNASYTRGRPHTPPPSAGLSTETQESDPGVANRGTSPQRQQWMLLDGHTMDQHLQDSVEDSRRASPELGMAEIQGQLFDPTSGLTFLHRAWERLCAREAEILPRVSRVSMDNQPMTMAGDRPLPALTGRVPAQLSDRVENRKLLGLYFDTCIATYRFLHQPAVELWLEAMERNVQDGCPVWHGIGHARASIVLTVLAIATTHRERSESTDDSNEESRHFGLSDEYFGMARLLTEEETGYPKLESAQARLAQTLYCLTTSRFNKSWFIFGTALQLISSIGLHRREHGKRRRNPKVDYIHGQCRLRTFWTAYILDNYLGVIFGRPRHFHDDDIDQDLPEGVDDRNMAALELAEAPKDVEDSPIDALVSHIKIARIIASTTREVYALSRIPMDKRGKAASRHLKLIEDWKSSLPPHLGSIRPSILIPSYRRQATVLKIAHSHAIMHAARLFLLSKSTVASPQAEHCVSAAKSVLELVNTMAGEGPIFHAFWWTHYVTFCALVVVYVWEIQQRRMGAFDTRRGSRIMMLAERCQTHLAMATASNSPSRRYAVILEELRHAATTDRHNMKQNPSIIHQGEPYIAASSNSVVTGEYARDKEDQDGAAQPLIPDNQHLDEWHWQISDWLDLDSSASEQFKLMYRFKLTSDKYQAFWTQMEPEDSMV